LRAQLCTRQRTEIPFGEQYAGNDLEALLLVLYILQEKDAHLYLYAQEGENLVVMMMMIGTEVQIVNLL
jgi:hypothetical protein